jgi:hypothetical protein
MRDRSWGVRSQFGTSLHAGARSARRLQLRHGLAARRFHTITAEIGQELVSIHGFLLRDGEWSKLTEGRREVLERKDGCRHGFASPAATPSAARSKPKAAA